MAAFELIWNKNIADSPIRVILECSYLYPVLYSCNHFFLVTKLRKCDNVLCFRSFFKLRTVVTPTKAKNAPRPWILTFLFEPIWTNFRNLTHKELFYYLVQWKRIFSLRWSELFSSLKETLLPSFCCVIQAHAFLRLCVNFKYNLHMSNLILLKTSLH